MTSTPHDRAVIPPAIVTGVLDIGRREGRSITSWLSGTGLEPRLLDSPDTLISYRQAATVLRRALKDLPGRALGLEVGGRDALLSFGFVGIAMRSSATVGDAATVILDLHRAAGSLLDVELESLAGSHPGGAELAVTFRQRWPEPALVEFLCEEAMASTAVIFRSMLGATWSPTRLDLAYPAPPYGARYHRFFRCPVHFGADAHRLVMPAELLNHSLATPHEPTRAAALEVSRRLLAPDGAPRDVVASLEMLLAGNLRRQLTMAEVARHLHVTERTLRRSLAESGERFSAVRDRVRERHATLLLQRSELAVREIAGEVGFSEAREFRRAYVRWTGRTPSQVRRSATS
ncbi:AraC family transcriptional regulator ligand-binding domain-containing protein [Kribbella italica]|uniref:AraC-like DNA-binding protein n=1 Tax=Kribbella italica TaxID=1540520 RepID=A0A7W9J5D4_9ACTN|nr:AraC-like DNA-binding protein [Kribbella italica]